MKVWLVQVTIKDDHRWDEERIKKFDDELSAISYVGSVATGERSCVVITKVHSVDFGISPPQVKALKPTLDGFRMVLVEA